MRVDFEGIEQCIPQNSAGVIDLDGFEIQADAGDHQPCVTGGVFRGDTHSSGAPTYNRFVFDAPVESFEVEISYMENELRIFWDGGTSGWLDQEDLTFPHFFAGTGPLTTLHFRSDDAFYEIDAIEWNWATVPEPGTGLLLGIGLLWAVVARRLRR